MYPSTSLEPRLFLDESGVVQITILLTCHRNLHHAPELDYRAPTEVEQAHYADPESLLKATASQENT